jgi:hypothetical protein
MARFGLRLCSKAVDVFATLSSVVMPYARLATDTFGRIQTWIFQLTTSRMLREDDDDLEIMVVGLAFPSVSASLHFLDDFLKRFGVASLSIPSR